MSIPSHRGALLHGDYGRDGFLTWTWEFHAAHDSRLALDIPVGSVLLAAGFAGRLHYISEGLIGVLTPEHLMTVPEVPGDLRLLAEGSSRHRGLAVALSPTLTRRFHSCSGRREEPAGAAVPGASGFHLSRMPMAVLSLTQQLAAPPQHAACLPIWFQAKTMELAALTLFAPELPTMKAHTDQSARESLLRALFLLERDLENPPTLEMLAQEVGCGPFQLSRLFGKLAGKTMPEFLRQKRMERAALLLRTTRQSVSEIALSVGYESFSAFTRGFVRELGVTPTLYRVQHESAEASAAKSGASQVKQSVGDA